MNPRFVVTRFGTVKKGTTGELMQSRIKRGRVAADECDYVIRFGAPGALRDSAIVLKASMRFIQEAA